MASLLAVGRTGYFYPRSPCGERRLDVTIIGRTWDISIHALLAESDLWQYLHPGHYRYFYPRSPCGERLTDRPLKTSTAPFLSTLSLRRATIGANNHVGVRENFYPRSPCGERPALSLPFGAVWVISIHALLAESDPLASRAKTILTISIHALLAESDRVNEDRYGQQY